MVCRQLKIVLCGKALKKLNEQSQEQNRDAGNVLKFLWTGEYLVLWAAVL